MTQPLKASGTSCNLVTLHHPFGVAVRGLAAVRGAANQAISSNTAKRIRGVGVDVIPGSPSSWLACRVEEQVASAAESVF